MQRQYWKRVRERARRETRSALAIETRERLVIGAVVTITAIALLWLFGSEGASWDEAVAKVGPFILLIIAVYPIVWTWKFIRAPAVLDQDAAAAHLRQITELQDRIDHMEAQLRPRLEFVFRTGDSLFLEESTSTIGRLHGFEVGRDAITGRVAVQNLSASSVRKVEMTLVSVLRAEHGEVTLERKLLSHAVGQPFMDVHPDSKAVFNLFYVKNDPYTKHGIVSYLKEEGPFLCLGPFADKSEPRRLGIGQYRLTVAVTGESVARAHADYFLAFRGYNEIEFRPWKESDDTPS